MTEGRSLTITNDLVSSEDPAVFNIANLPILLYRMLNESFGIGEELCQTSHDFAYMRVLDPANKLVCVPATIEARRLLNSTQFNLWSYNCRHRFDRVKDGYERGLSFDYYIHMVERPVLEITVEGVINLPRLDLRMKAGLKSRLIPLLSAIVLKAHQISTHPQCVSGPSWDVFGVGA